MLFYSKKEFDARNRWTMTEANGKFEISDDMVFRLSDRKSPKDVKLRNIEWAVIIQLDGEKTVEQIAEILALSPIEVEDIFSNLLREGLLELVTVSAKKQIVGADVFQDIQQTLRSYVGPIADFLLEDALDKMNKKEQNFDSTSLPTLIELLSIKIDDPEKQLEFQTEIFEKYRDLILGTV